MPVDMVRNVRVWCGPVRVHGCLRKPDRPAQASSAGAKKTVVRAHQLGVPCAGTVTTSQGCVYNVLSSGGTTGGSPPTTAVFLYMFRQWGLGEVCVTVGARKCCGCSQVLWVLASAVGARKCCGCSQVLWVLASAGRNALWSGLFGHYFVVDLVSVGVALGIRRCF
jgi:hypothetical protein